ncbi:MAG: PAS domain-containing protein, partial [Rhodospirillaceae bacterium]
MYGGSVFDGLDGRVLQDPNVDVLLDQIPAPIFVKDNDFRYTHVNETFCSLLNIKKTDFVGKSVWDIATPELAKVYDAADRRLVEEGGIQTYESKAHTSKGGVVWVQFQKKC